MSKLRSRHRKNGRRSVTADSPIIIATMDKFLNDMEKEKPIRFTRAISSAKQLNLFLFIGEQINNNNLILNQL
jgi:hypothetical protein